MSIVRGKNGLVLCKQRHDGWTMARRAIFLDVLATTAHVGHAAAAAGMDPATARRLRRRDTGFALLWAEAMAAGQQRLREELLARSLGQLDGGDNPAAERREPAIGTLPPFDADEARKTLETLARLDRIDAPRRGRPDYASDAEVTALLTKRLAALAKRLGGA